MSSKPTKSVCVIGAGTAGLCALKYCLAQDFAVVAYEQASEIGGTWVYTENLPKTEDDDVHNSMYRDLRTNLPKEVMGFNDFTYTEGIRESFIGATEVLNFLKAYAAHFKLKPFIKLQHSVIRVRPYRQQWEVIVRNDKSAVYSVLHYDFVFVCNGHYTTPLYPEIVGLEDFQGRRIHSHLYRTPDIFKDEKVLILGAGPSGMDICGHVYKKAHTVYLCHHMDPQPVTAFMPNVIQKPDVQRINAHSVTFKDGSTVEVTYIIFCTGYKFTFPFLSTDCGVHVDDNFVQPLYKHCININYPSMALIGLPYKVCPTHLIDLQVRFVLKYYTEQKEWPSRADMLADQKKEMEARWSSGLSKHKAHEMGVRQFDYFRDLAALADIEPVKPFVEQMMRACSRKYLSELESYRNARFKVIDDFKFIQLDD